MQIVKIKRWLRENFVPIFAGVILGIIFVACFQAWERHKVFKIKTASKLYEQMIAAYREKNLTNVQISAERIIDLEANSAYDVFAMLMLAQLAEKSGNFIEAEKQLRTALKISSQTKLKHAKSSSTIEMEHIIRLRLSSLLIAMEKFDMAKDILNTSDTGEYGYRYDELRSEITSLQTRFQQFQHDINTNKSYSEKIENLYNNGIDKIATIVPPIYYKDEDVKDIIGDIIVYIYEGKPGETFNIDKVKKRFYRNVALNLEEFSNQDNNSSDSNFIKHVKRDFNNTIDGEYFLFGLEVVVDSYFNDRNNQFSDMPNVCAKYPHLPVCTKS